MRRVLIVDDDPLVRDLVAAVLTDDRFTLAFAGTGERALAAAAEDPPDMVVLDVMMPGMDGYEVCRRLRGDLPDARIVILTALASEGEQERALRAGADAFLTKPFSPLVLRDLMDQAQR